MPKIRERLRPLYEDICWTYKGKAVICSGVDTLCDNRKAVICYTEFLQMQNKKKEKKLKKGKIIMKRVLVACGNGIATSTVVATKIREKCEENGVAVTVNQCKLLEVESKADDYDLLVTTGKFTGGTVTIPVITAISLLTGIGEEATLDQIVEELKK